MAQNLAGGAVLFDLDGTLIDTAADLAAAMNHALGAEGLPAQPVDEVRHLVGHGARRMLERGYLLATGEAVGEAHLNASFERFLDYYSANIAVHSTPFGGVIDLISALRADGAKIAICTNKREKLARSLIEALEIADLFDVIVGADSAVKPKPDRAPIDLCIKRTGAERALMVGDSDTDICAALAASIPCFVATFGYGPLELSAQAVLSFDHYSLLEPHLRTALAV